MHDVHVDTIVHELMEEFLDDCSVYISLKLRCKRICNWVCPRVTKGRCEDEFFGTVCINGLARLLRTILNRNLMELSYITPRTRTSYLVSSVLRYFLTSNYIVNSHFP